jgi:hypothetical protein
MKRIGIVVVLFACGAALAMVAACAEPSKAKIVALIDQLVSPNHPPDDSAGLATYPRGFDNAAQSRIYRAFERLAGIGLPAFPYLRTRLDDKRYCMTMDTGPGDYNFSVGRICRLIMDGRLQPYGWYTVDANGRVLEDTKSRPRRPRYSDHHRLDRPKEFENWWVAHKQKSLRDVQIEALEWTIAWERKNSKDYFPKEVEKLKAVLADLRKADKPLPPYIPFTK